MDAEKTLIKISEIKMITEKRVLVIRDTGDELWLPISQAERFGSRAFIPTWPARKIGVDQKGKNPQADVNRWGYDWLT